MEIIFPISLIACMIIVISTTTIFADENKFDYPVWPEDFRFSSQGKLTGEFKCIPIRETYRTERWKNTYLCWRGTENRYNIQFSHHGVRDNLKCIKTDEPQAINSEVWDDNYLCQSYDSPYDFTWRNNGLPDAKEKLSCIAWKNHLFKPKNRKKWQNNYLCAPPTINYASLPEPSFPEDFKVSYGSIPKGYHCIAIFGPLSSDTSYTDNNFCWRNTTKNPGFIFSINGPISGMNCLHINVPEDKKWYKKNYLCVPSSSQLRLNWSHKGILEDHECLKWGWPDKESWDNNYLCHLKCKLTAIKILDSEYFLKKKFVGYKLIDSASAVSCSNTEQPGLLKLDINRSTQQTFGIELAGTSEVNWSASTKVEVETSAKFFGSGVALTFGLEVGAGGSKSYTSTDSKDTSTGKSRKKGIEISFSQPGAIFSYAKIIEYKFEKDHVPIEMNFECKSGHTFKKTSSVKINKKEYNHVNFETMSRKLTEHECREKKPHFTACLMGLESNYSVYFDNTKDPEVSEELLAKIQIDFDKCFTNVTPSNKSK